MTLWDLNSAKRYLKEKNISNYNENYIFEAYDVYQYERKEKFDEWILETIKIAPKKKTKNTYNIEINFDSKEEDKTYFNGNINYSNDINKTDKCIIKSSSIKIEAIITPPIK